MTEHPCDICDIQVDCLREADNLCGLIKRIKELEAQHCIHWDQCVDYEHDLGAGR